VPTDENARPGRSVPCSCVGGFWSVNLLGFQVEQVCVAIIAQKKRLAAVADENKRIVRNLDHWREPALQMSLPESIRNAQQSFRDAMRQCVGE
jgi:hypothetical protein